MKNEDLLDSEIENITDTSIFKFTPIPVDVLDENLLQYLRQQCEIKKKYLPIAETGIEVWVCEEEGKFYYTRQYQKEIENSIQDFNKNTWNPELFRDDLGQEKRFDERMKTKKGRGKINLNEQLEIDEIQ